MFIRHMILVLLFGAALIFGVSSCEQAVNPDQATDNANPVPSQSDSNQTQ